MAEQSKLPNAIKHGVYCKSVLLPGENAADFERLHQHLVDEFKPHGAIEEDIVATMAGLMWRKRNLSTYDVAREARELASFIRSLAQPHMRFAPPGTERARDEAFAAEDAAEEYAQKELGDRWELVKIGEVATTDHLLQQLSIIDRLDGMFDKCIKRLLIVRGVKSMTIQPSDAKVITAPAADRSG